MNQPIRVLVVDDSAFMRQMIARLLETDPGITVVGSARDGRQGLEMALDLRPDVITLDVEMPRLDGLATLEELVEQCPTPVVMVSSHTSRGAEVTIRALALGAVDFVTKPSGPVSMDMARVRDDLLSRVKAAAAAVPRYQRRLPEPSGRPWPPRTGADRLGPALLTPAGAGRAARRVAVIGTSTGGPGALHRVIPRLPADLPAGVLVVQHMPPGFTRSLAERLNQFSALPVREAVHGEPVVAGTVLVAPGGRHMVVDADGCLQITDDPPLHGVRPAADKTLMSAAGYWRHRCLGVLLTGMGSDGAMGFTAVKGAGGRTVAEHPSTCVIYGMPKVAAEMGLADEILPVDEVAAAVVRFALAEIDGERG